MTGRISQTVFKFGNQFLPQLREAIPLFPSMPAVETSSASLAHRRFTTTVGLQSPGKRMTTFFQGYPTIQHRCQFISAGLLGELPEQIRQRVVDERGPPDTTKEYLLNLLDTHAHLKFGSHPKTYWGHFPMDDVESVAGVTTRYSSNSFADISKTLPNIIRETHGEGHSLSILELGGFAFSDSFLLCTDLERAGISIHKFTGIDLNQKAYIAADFFNRQIAQMENHTLICQDAMQVFPHYVPDHDKFIAIRFLATLSPIEIEVFFSSMGQVLKPGDILVFNYTLYDDEVVRVGGSPNFSLEGGSGVFVLSLKQGPRIQTFLTQQKVDSLLKQNNLDVVANRYEDRLVGYGNEVARGQKNPYNRMTLFVTKSS